MIPTPYQLAVINDPSRMIAWVASRQIGKSFTGAMRCTIAAMGNKQDILVASPTMRQSLEALRKCRDAARAASVATSEGEYFATKTSIEFANGSRIISVPGTPDTVRGFSGSVWLDEFAFFQDPVETWTALLPTISSRFSGLDKTVMVTSTPNGITGKGKMFYDIVHSGAERGWSVHRTTIEEAAPYTHADVAALRTAMDDPDAWSQEYMCEFRDTVSVLLPYELIAGAQDPEASEHGKTSGGRLFAGFDFGRVGDPSCLWVLEETGGKLVTREVTVLRDMSTQAQEREIAEWVERCTVCCIDYTGPGIGLGDLLVGKFGEYAPDRHLFGKVEPVTFSAAVKRELFPRLRRQFEAPVRIRIPMSADIEADLHEMRQTTTPSGETTYSARRSSEGHADRCVALALAVRAWEHGAAKKPPQAPVAFGRFGNFSDRRI